MSTMYTYRAPESCFFFSVLTCLSPSVSLYDLCQMRRWLVLTEYKFGMEVLQSRLSFTSGILPSYPLNVQRISQLSVNFADLLPQLLVKNTSFLCWQIQLDRLSAYLNLIQALNAVSRNYPN